MHSEKLYQIALTQVPYIGHVHAKILIEHFGSASAIFTATTRALNAVTGIGERRAKAIGRFSRFDQCEKILRQIEEQQLQTLFIGEENYPVRLLNCYDPPTLLYCRGNTNLNNRRTIAVIGTRHHSDYGKQQVDKFIRELSGLPVTIISGMAYGIDGLAHRAALKYQLPTIGILAHGLDAMYPPEHKSLAREILRNEGGFITEFPIGTKPDKHHFPIRNRIVAGLSDAVVIIETGLKGGSMITAELALGYNCEVFAFPGRAGDTRSSGCNFLIGKNKATLITDAAGFLQEKEWQPAPVRPVVQTALKLPYELNASESILLHLLTAATTLPIDELYIKSGLSPGNAASAILSLELKSLIEAVPGKRYRLRT